MFRSGDTIENSITGERLVFLQTASETNGELVVVEAFVQPGGCVAAAHVHPEQEERFHVLGGTLRLRLGNETVEVSAGGRVTVPAGTAHRFWNAGTDEAHFLCEVRPALHFEQLLETMFALAREGKTNANGMPNVLRLAVIAQEYADTIRLPFLPAIVQRLGLGLGAPLGRLLGYSATHSPQAQIERIGSWSTA
jgi:quercetin dioxygenase-like cupin family protein